MEKINAEDVILSLFILGFENAKEEFYCNYFVILFI